MFQSFLTALTIISIAFHATVGCFAHHYHSCDTAAKQTPEAVAAEGCCSHDHATSTRVEPQDALPADEHSRELAESGDNHDHAPCIDDHCNFVAVHRDQDVHQMLTFSKWCQVLGNDLVEVAGDTLLPNFGLHQHLSLALTGPCADRSAHQVWLL
ncbi:hypothetical protein AB1L42_23425 [Thalassoglobus sp. JC818]|uniref:hypothetical protein n=1 Tax=Thalassoglobus sp. JC818 TaxID=3232136 RepID=UPI00345B3049